MPDPSIYCIEESWGTSHRSAIYCISSYGDVWRARHNELRGYAYVWRAQRNELRGYAYIYPPSEIVFTIMPGYAILHRKLYMAIIAL